jgi:putative Mg2+ transporter-C (MgtC) family protein
MNPILEELLGSLPDTHAVIRLAAALLAGGVIGLQRERAGKAAGLRTPHVLVATGTALFVVASAASKSGDDATSRVVQGLATGIGFIGAGAILELEGVRRSRGLTTAAGIWMTAALGVAIGLGRLGTAAIGVLLS